MGVKTAVNCLNLDSQLIFIYKNYFLQITFTHRKQDKGQL